MEQARYNNLVKVNPENAEDLYAKARSDAEKRFKNLEARLVD
jgi:hypothetical protein